MKVSIIGLGNVGGALYKHLNGKNVDVYGVDVNFEIINGFGTEKVSGDYSIVSESDVIVLCLPTTVDLSSGKLDISVLLNGIKAMSSFLSGKELVILESTVGIGTCGGVVYPVLRDIGVDFVYCPERIDPGNKEYGVGDVPRVLAGSSDNAIERSVDFYSSIVGVDVTTMG